MHLGRFKIATDNVGRKGHTFQPGKKVVYKLDPFVVWLVSARAALGVLCIGTGSSLAAATDFYAADTRRARHPSRFKWVTAQ